MKSSSVKTLCGYYINYDKYPTFVMPVFKGSGQYYLQLASKNKPNVIGSFEHVNLDFCEIEPFGENKQFRRNVGDELLFGFAWGVKDADFCTQSILCDKLRKRIGDLNSLPFVKLDVLEFIGEKKKIIQQLKEIKALLAEKNPEYASRWYNYYRQDIDSNENIGFWKLISALSEAIVSAKGDKHLVLAEANFKQVRSMIGKNPKLKNKVQAFIGSSRFKIGKQGPSIKLNAKWLINFMQLRKYLFITKINIPLYEWALVPNNEASLGKRYYRKRHVCKYDHDDYKLI